jgi:hypothetical protein
MKFFLDTADINEIREAMEWGLLDGITDESEPGRQNGQDLWRRAARNR